MGAIVKELKEKIVAAGGDVTGVQTVSEALDKLPAGGGSGGIFLITLTPNESFELLTSDKTAREIINAAEAGMMVFASYKDESLAGAPYPIISTFVLVSYTDTWMQIRDLIDSSNVEAEYDNLDTYPVFGW